MATEILQLQIRDRQPNNRRLVQLASDGARKWKHLGQFVELVVLFAATRSRRIARFFFAQLENAEGIDMTKYIRFMLSVLPIILSESIFYVFF